MVNNVDLRELQMLEQYLNQFTQQIELYSRQFEMVEQRRIESLGAIESLEAIGEEHEAPILLQLGGGVSVRTRVTEPEHVLVNIGSDVVVQRSTQEAVDYLRARITEIEAAEKKMSSTIEQIRRQADEIARRVETGYRQIQQAQQQGTPKAE
jgi:prefoldin alpha subunit